MKLIKNVENEIKGVLQTYWDSYFKGDLETWASYLPDNYHNIGTTKEEIWNSKEEIVTYTLNMLDQMVGMAEFRNKQVDIIPYPPYFMSHELGDVFIKTEEGWTYYAKLRLSSLLKKTEAGWKIVHQHGSYPDTKVDEGETFAFDQVTEENLQLREAIQRRTFELEAKNRELEVEGALERVRAKAVAMRASTDLLDIVVAMRSEFIKLGHKAHYFWHMMWLPNTYEKAMTSGDGTKIGFVMQLPRHIHGDIPLLDKWEQSKEPSVVYAMQVEEALDYVNKMITLGDFQHIDPQAPTEEDIRAIGGLTFVMARTTHGEIGYSLPGVVEHPPQEDIDILVKFAAAFDLAHQRFLDLQKAEAQAREAQIEAALERVRSRSMAMHKTSELSEVIIVVFRQLEILNLVIDTCYIDIFDQNNEAFNIWIGAGTAIYPEQVHLPYSNHPIHQLNKRARKNNVEFFTFSEDDKSKDVYFEHFYENAKGIDVPKERKEHIANGLGISGSTVLGRHSSITLFNYQKIVYSSTENDILNRVNKVFQQTYTRFLDLQKAEAQAQEAKIEASLEKVRGVALTLKKSDDMLDIAQVLYEQLLVLGFSDIRNAIIDIHNEDNETFIDYDYSHDMSSAVTQFSFYGDPVIEQQIQKVQSSHDAFFEIELRGEQLEELIETRRANGEKDDPRLRQTDLLTYNLYSFGNGAIGISNFGVLSDDQKEVLKRFRNVFTFAYKRYTDLAKAEAQALEAKIEAALEKVRNVALGMTQSDHLLEIVQALYEQLQDLGFDGIRNAIIDVNNEDEETFMDYDYSDEMGGTVTLMSYNDDPTLEEQLRVIASTTDSYSEMVLEGQQLQDLIAMRRKNGEADDPRLENATSVSYILYAFGNGAIGISNFGVLNDHQRSILDRFRNVFIFAYQRYNDLAHTEAQAAALLAEKQRLEVALSNLQQTQDQLIQSEKMASLGELTAGIAHEIQNPLNFVNNFSEVSNELIDELDEELSKGDLEEVKLLLVDIKSNLEKINHHGKRADGIVKGMLQHSRKSNAKKEPTDINKLADEYLRLAYHGLRAKDKSFNATLETHFDEDIETVAVIPQDIGRVILNLITNAFYACNERKKSSEEKNFKPTVSVITKQHKKQVLVSIKDNGIGIPKQVVDKIFQPFFTTKPTGQGTGLGLSMSYDIIKAHGGELKVETEENVGTTFQIILPTS